MILTNSIFTAEARVSVSVDGNEWIALEYFVDNKVLDKCVEENLHHALAESAVGSPGSLENIVESLAHNSYSNSCCVEFSVPSSDLGLMGSHAQVSVDLWMIRLVPARELLVSRVQ